VNPLEVTDVLSGGVPAVLFNKFGHALNIFTAVRFWGEKGDWAATVSEVVGCGVLFDLPSEEVRFSVAVLFDT
jgi:hypothetical protein